MLSIVIEALYHRDTRVKICLIHRVRPQTTEMCAHQDSNLEPIVYKTIALPIEL